MNANMFQTMRKDAMLKNAPYTSPLMTVEPGAAKAMLGYNFDNRSVRTLHVEKIVHDILNDKWVYDGCPIVFDTNGTLINGQHRLIACVKANKPIKTCLTFGIEPEAKVTVDTCSHRSITDNTGIPSRSISISKCIVSILGESVKRKSHNQIIFTYYQHQDAIDMIMSIVGTGHAGGRIPAYVKAFFVLMYEMHQITAEQINSFCSTFSKCDIYPEYNCKVLLRSKDDLLSFGKRSDVVIDAYKLLDEVQDAYFNNKASRTRLLHYFIDDVRKDNPWSTSASTRNI